MRPQSKQQHSSSVRPSTQQRRSPVPSSTSSSYINLVLFIRDHFPLSDTGEQTSSLSRRYSSRERTWLMLVKYIYTQCAQLRSNSNCAMSGRRRIFALIIGTSSSTSDILRRPPAIRSDTLVFSSERNSSVSFASASVNESHVIELKTGAPYHRQRVVAHTDASRIDTHAVIRVQRHFADDARAVVGCNQICNKK